MSRIQTPTVAVNPNVELASREAPTIVYQPEPYVPETYFDYEQLSNVLGAGVQAAKTFLDVETRAAEQARQNEILRFKRGLSEARLKATRIADETGQYDDQPVKDFLSSYDYENSMEEIRILLNEEWTGIAEYNIKSEQERQKLVAKNNTDVLSTVFTGRLTQFDTNFDLLGTEAQNQLLRISTDPDQVFGFVIDQFTPEELGRWNSLTTIDRDALTQKLADNVSGFMQNMETRRTKVRERKNAMLVEQLDSVRSNTLLRSMAGLEPSTYVERELGDREHYDIYVATRMEIDRGISIDKINKDWENVVRDAVVRAEKAPPNVIENLRQFVRMDDAISGEARNTMMNTLDAALTKSIDNVYVPAMDTAIMQDDPFAIASIVEQVSADPLASDDQIIKLKTKANQAYRDIQTKRRDLGIGDVSVKWRGVMEQRELTELELQQARIEMFQTGQSMNSYVDTEGNTQDVENPAQFMANIDKQYDALKTANEKMVRAVTSAQIDGIKGRLMQEIVGPMGAMPGRTGPVSTFRIPGQFQPDRIMSELMAIPEDERAKATRELNTWVQSQYFPTVRQALMQKYGLESWDAPAGGKDPKALDRERAYAEFTAMRVFWAYSGGDRDFKTSIQTNMYNQMQRKVEEVGASRTLLEALNVYRSGVPRDYLREFFGGNEQADEYLRVLSEVDAAVRNGADINEAFKDATQAYRLDPRRSRIVASLGVSDSIAIEQALADKIDDLGVEMQDAIPIYRHVFLNAALMQAPPGVDADARIAAGEEAVDSMLTVAGNSIVPTADLARMRHGPSYFDASVYFMTGMTDAVAVVVDVDNSGRYTYALRNSSGNSIAIKENIPGIGGKRTFTLEDIESEQVRSRIVASIPERLRMIEVETRNRMELAPKIGEEAMRRIGLPTRGPKF